MATLLILCLCLLLWCFLLYRNAYVQIIYFLPKLFDIWLWVYIFSCILITNLCLRCTFILILVSLCLTADYRNMYQTCFSSQLFGAYNCQFPCWWITLLTVLITSGQRNWRWLVHADGMISNQGQLCSPYLKFLRVSAWSCELFKYNHAFPAWKIPVFFHHRLIKMSAL